MTEKRIAIAGAGIAGLTTALALLQQGFKVDVYEQASQLGEVGAGLQISPNGTKVLQNLVHGSDSPESAAREIQIFFPNK